MDVSNGCLLVADPVSLGPCSDSTSEQWAVAATWISDVVVPPPSPPVGAIVGGVVGGVAVAGAVVAILVYKRRRTKAKGSTDRLEVAEPKVVPPSQDVSEKTPPDVETGKEIQSSSAPVVDAAIVEVVETRNESQASSVPIIVESTTLEVSADETSSAETPPETPELSSAAPYATVAFATAVSPFATVALPTAMPVTLPAPERLQTLERYPPLAILNTVSSGAASDVVLSSRSVKEAASAGANNISSGLTAGSGAQSLPDTKGTKISPASGPVSPTPQVPSKLLITKSDVVIDRSRKLGEGGFGIVYVGTLRGSMTVAVKTIRGDLEGKMRDAFIREVQTWEGLVQRNVLPLMAVCLSPPLMVTDLIEQGNLRQYLRHHGWDQSLGRSLLLDVTNGMTYLHSLNVLHGDLKSLNILVDGTKAMITDFGMSRIMRGADERSEGKMMAGTPGFIAPELLSGQPMSRAADVYAFAMVCYEVVSRGKHPFGDPNLAAEMVHKIVLEKARPDRPEEVLDEMWKLIEDCWDQNPDQRPVFTEIRPRLAAIQ